MARRKPLLALLFVALPTLATAEDPPWIARSTRGMVASDSPEASRIGARVLANGGNAFDAAIATSFALAVARPESTGLGGGGFMVAYTAKDGSLVALDFRETAPAAATVERYGLLQAERGAEGPPITLYGGSAVGVPGQLAGIAEIQRRYATRPLSDLIQPALELAEAGFTADEHYRDAVSEVRRIYERWPRLKLKQGRLYQTLLRNGQIRDVGDKVTRPDLARALRRIADHGRGEIYGPGMIGVSIVNAVNATGGDMTLDDLTGYRVRERKPLRVRSGDYEIVSMPPPSSGGVCIVESLNVLREMLAVFSSIREADERGYLQSSYVDSLKHAFADRARWLGDPDFASIPVDVLISRAYARHLATKQIGCVESFGSTKLPDDQGTSHFCVADKDGNVVAITETVNGSFGSLVVAEPYGIILNNELDDFSIASGQPNLYGLIQGRANLIVPGKRPLSSMSPTIVLSEGKPVLVLGGSGGPRIITSVLAVMLYSLELGQPLEQAMTHIRIHNQWQPEETYFDQTPPDDLVRKLSQAGHVLSQQRKTGIVQAIQFLKDGTMVGASDPRKGGRPAGVR